MTVARTPFQRMSGRHIALSETGFSLPRASQISDSGTSFRIHRTASAGRMPTKKTARQPKVGEHRER